MESYYAPTTMKDLRSFSTSRAHYDASPSPSPPPYKELKLKNGKAGIGPSGFASKSWSLNESELQRKKRVAGYRPTVWRGRWRARSERALSGSRTPAIMWFMDGGDCFSLAPVVESWCLLSGAHFLFHYFRLLFGVNTQYYNATGPDSDYSHNSGIPDNATKITVLHHGSLWQKLYLSCIRMQLYVDSIKI